MLALGDVSPDPVLNIQLINVCLVLIRKMECRDDQVDLLASTTNLATWKLIARAFFGSFFFTWALKALVTTVVTRCCPNKFYSRFSYSSSWGNWGRIQSPPQHSPPLSLHVSSSLLDHNADNTSTEWLHHTITNHSLALSQLHYRHSSQLFIMFLTSVDIILWHLTTNLIVTVNVSILHLTWDSPMSIYIYCQISSFLLMIQTRPWSGCGFQTFLSPLLILFQIFIDNLQLFR